MCIGWPGNSSWLLSYAYSSHKSQFNMHILHTQRAKDQNKYEVHCSCWLFGMQELLQLWVASIPVWELFGSWMIGALVFISTCAWWFKMSLHVTTLTAMDWIAATLVSRQGSALQKRMDSGWIVPLSRSLRSSCLTMRNGPCSASTTTMVVMHKRPCSF